jgi:hypothetical protein
MHWRTFTHICLTISLVICGCISGQSYTLQFTDQSAVDPIRWPASIVYVSLSTSLNDPPANIKKGSDVLGAVRKALKRWSSAAKVDFVELSSPTQGVSSIAGGGDGVNLISVASTRENAALFRGQNAVQPARTRIFFDASGNITEADIVLNPTQKFSTDGTFNTYDLESTFTHEIGHMLGLDHSAVIGSTMQPRQAWNGTFYATQFSGRVLSSDDILGIQALYGARNSQTKSGSISGSLTYPGGTPAAGVNVWVEDATDGRVVESVLTRASGVYKLGSLAPGAYNLYLSSLDGQTGHPDMDSSKGTIPASNLKAAAIRTKEVGRIEVAEGSARIVNVEVAIEPSDFQLSVLGVNNQASSVAVPLIAGNTYTIFAGGKGVVTEELLSEKITVSSPFIHVDRTTISQEAFGKGIDVVSFQVSVDPNTPPGTYSLWVGSRNGALGCLVGALVISEGSADAVANEFLLPTGRTIADDPTRSLLLHLENSGDEEMDSTYSEMGAFNQLLIVRTFS